MDRTARNVGTLLNRTATGALPLSRLLAEMEADGNPLREGEDRLLLARLASWESFRVLDPWRGPWDRNGWDRRGRLRGDSEPAPRSGDVWILGLTPATSSVGAGARMVRLIREAVRAWGRVVDEGAPTSVARWIRATEEVERACRSLLREQTQGG